MSTLMKKELQMKLAPVDAIPKPFSSVVDGMVHICESNSIGLTYYEVADNIFKFVSATASGASWIGMVFDVSRTYSIKNAERCQCSEGKLQWKTIEGAAQIKQQKAVLSDRKNKTKFLGHLWVNHPSITGNLQLFVASEKKFIYMLIVFIKFQHLKLTRKKPILQCFCLSKTDAATLYLLTLMSLQALETMH